MADEKATKVTVSIYPSQIEKVNRVQALFGIRKWSQALQRLIDIAEIPAQPTTLHCSRETLSSTLRPTAQPKQKGKQ